MNVLFIGHGGKGSFEIRGNQISQALGARAVWKPTAEDINAADMTVAIKRVPDEALRLLRESGKPWVWDCVDAYPQPDCSTWNSTQSVDWLKGELERLQPHAVIWPNARMCDDAEWHGPQEIIYHHHRPGIRINPIRERIQTIGYEGSPRYLEGWIEAINQECGRIGAAFMVNPPHLADVDVVLALRGPRWNGYCQQAYKSNVKLANAHASGTPFIGMPEAGYMETRTGAEYWVKTLDDLATALKWLESQSAREEVSERFLKAALPIERVADQYRGFLCASKF